MGFGDASKKDKAAASAKSKDNEAKSAAEDVAWSEKDKGNLSKASRAADKDAKADDKLARKAEAKALEEAENEGLSSSKAAAKKAPSKMTQAEIARRQALMASVKPKAKSKTVNAPKVEPNMNREAGVDASGLDAAIGALSVGDDKPSKMTYALFEARELEGIKADNPGLKQSQAKERCFKMWERSPDNPKNQEKATRGPGAILGHLHAAGEEVEIEIDDELLRPRHLENREEKKKAAAGLEAEAAAEEAEVVAATIWRNGGPQGSSWTSRDPASASSDQTQAKLMTRISTSIAQQ